MLSPYGTVTSALVVLVTLSLIRAGTGINAWRRRFEAVPGEGIVPVGYP